MTDDAPADDVARPETTEGAGARASSRDGSASSHDGGDEVEPLEGAAEGDAPRRKKRKKRRAGPGFARRFPRDAELDRLVEAFDRGNYAAVREGAGRLAKSADREPVRRAARELLRRINPDPLAVVLTLAAIGLLAFLALWHWS